MNRRYGLIPRTGLRIADLSATRKPRARPAVFRACRRLVIAPVTMAAELGNQLSFFQAGQPDVSPQTTPVSSKKA
jgi:hypothetical protein